MSPLPAPQPPPPPPPTAGPTWPDEPSAGPSPARWWPAPGASSSPTTAAPTERPRGAWITFAAAVVTVGVGTVEALLARSTVGAPLGPTLLVVLLAAVAIALTSRSTAVALGLGWLVVLAHLALPVPLLLTDAGLLAVVLGCARWASRSLAVVAALSGAAAVLVLLVGALSGYADLSWLLVVIPPTLLDPVVAAWSNRSAWFLAAALPPLAIVGTAAAVGWGLRSADEAARSRGSQARAEAAAAAAETERAQAAEIAALREQQARLANDVHDVVGHSLAVILAQAEGAAYLSDDRSDELQAAMANIAATARSSLRDVRAVLSQASTDDQPLATAAALDEIVRGVARAGTDVRLTVTGQPRPLPPERSTVAQRVLQELLTNAVRHGTRAEPVDVELTWGDVALRLRVRNATEAAAPPPPPGEGHGHGLPGMRQRLGSVGGQLEVRASPGEPGAPSTWDVTATLPYRQEHAR